MEGNKITDEEFQEIRVRLLVDSSRDSDLRNLDLTVQLLKAIEAEFIRRNNKGTCYGPRAFENWLTEHLMARNKRPLILLAELEQDGTPILKKIAEIVMKKRYGIDEANKHLRRNNVISWLALLVGIISLIKSFI